MNDILRSITCASLVTLLCAACISPPPAEQMSPAGDSGTEVASPNIIIIMADDLGWGDIGLNGADLIKTPHIDRIGQEGVRLTSFYAGANVCTPSRASLLTGRYAFRSGMQDVLFPDSETGMPPSEITLPELLKDVGYSTGMIGKWHLGDRSEYWPTRHGFDEFFGVAYSNDMEPFDLYRQDEIIESPADQRELSNKYTDEAVAFIAERAEMSTPFFLYIAETFPHIPLFVPEEASGRSAAGLYGDVIEHLDHGVGKILAALDEHGIADNTLVIVTSDNGPWFEGSAGAAYRGRKGGMYEGGYLVPFVARWPDRIGAGHVSDAMAMNIDVLPTLANFAGTDVPDDRKIDGRDISSVLLGADQSPHDLLYFFDGKNIAAVRDERFRLVVRDIYRGWTPNLKQMGGPLLFDLQTDSQERFSFAREYPEVTERLMARIIEMQTEVEIQSEP